MTRIAVCGGVYINPYALRAFVEDARAGGAEQLYCLGDLGGYFAEPDAIWPLLVDNEIIVVAGNYGVAIGRGDTGCGCGYASSGFGSDLSAYSLRDYTRLKHVVTRLDV